jgi:hypothetical protein
MVWDEDIPVDCVCSDFGEHADKMAITRQATRLDVNALLNNGYTLPFASICHSL